MFKVKSKYHIKEIMANVEGHPSEVVKALAEIISNGDLLENKNKFKLYLREYKNVYYLTDISDWDSIPLESDYFDSVYTTRVDTIENLTSRYTSETLDFTIDRLQRTVDSQDEFKAIIKTLPIAIQSMFVEYAFIAKKKGVDFNGKMVDAILGVYKDYLKVIGDTDLLILDDKNLKCLRGDRWVPCPASIEDAYKLSLQSVVSNLESSPVGYYGIYIVKKDGDDFQIRDVTDKSLINNPDARRKSTGRTCTTINKKFLLAMVVATKLPYDPSGRSRNDILEEIDPSTVETKNMPDLNELKTEDLDRILYWKGKKVKEICSALQTWFNENELMQTVYSEK